MWNKHMQRPISINLGYTRAGRHSAARAHFLSVERSNDKHSDEVSQLADSSLELSIRGHAHRTARSLSEPVLSRKEQIAEWKKNISTMFYL